MAEIHDWVITSSLVFFKLVLVMGSFYLFGMKNLMGT